MTDTLFSQSIVNFELVRNTAGLLQLTASNKTVHDGVFPIRAFPISSPEGGGLSLLSKSGHELVWIESLDDLPNEMRTLIKEELAQREFMPEILKINRVYSFATPSTWLVKTNRGDTELTLKSEDHIRRLSMTSLLISDSQGVSFLIREIDQLDSHSRKLLDRFL
jgi:hypothetical protein